VATRDWHPPDHCSFVAQGGSWPPHCIKDTPGAEFPVQLELPDSTMVISKGTEADREAYSGFEGTDLAARLHALDVKRVFVGGLATDYCVQATVQDAVRHGFGVVVLREAVRAVNIKADDEHDAIAAMRATGATIIDRGAFNANDRAI
jgi:nicotinamidase/pyrazinamidase